MMPEEENLTPRGDQLLQMIRAHGTRNREIDLVRDTIIKDGPRTFKRAAVLRVASHQPGERSYDKLILEAYDHAAGRGFDLDSPKYRWHCVREEIDRLRVFLESYGEVSTAGAHAVVPVSVAGGVDMETVVDFLLTHDVDASDIARIIEGVLVHRDEFSSLPQVDEEDQSRTLSAALRVAHRSHALRRLQELIEDEATEPEFQSLLDRNWWLFGGQYVGKVQRRRWTERDTLDMLLQTADGYFDVIELKRSTARLSKVDHGVVIVSSEVNDAVNQAANYIAGIELRRPSLLAEYDIDFYKLKAKVIIGYVGRGNAENEAERKAIRTYNSHLHRIEVVTYDELVRIGEHIVSADRNEGGASAPDDPQGDAT